MRHLGIITACVVLAACGSVSADKTSIVTPSAPFSEAAPSHAWAETSKGVYYYVGAVSENDKASGKGDGAVSGFKFLGQNADQEYVLALIGDQGEVLEKAYCRNPCVIVRDGDGQKHGAAGTVVAAAFSDAINGQMGKPSGKSD